MKRKWWIAGLGVVLVGGSAAGWLYWNEEPAPTASAAVTTTVRKGELVSSIGGTGSIEPADRETIVSGVAGTVEEVFFRDGDTVKKGDVLLTFEQEDAADQLASKRIELERQRLELEQLQLQFKEAAESGDAAQQSIGINIKKQELTIESLENEIASLQEEDAIDPITAPIDGKLSGFAVEPGDALRENAELGEVVDFARMKMVVGVDELDIAEAALGQEATVLVDALPDAVFAGQVAAIAEEGTANNGVASFDVTVLLTDIEGLKAGMSAEASIVTAKKTDALFLPIDAVQSFRGQYFVSVPSAEGSAEQGRSPPAQQGQAEGQTAPQRRPDGGASTGRGQAGSLGDSAAAGQSRVFVEVGIHNEDSIEIVSGLAEGDEVIVPTTASASSAAPGAVPGGFGIGGFGGGAVPGGFGGGGGAPGGFGGGTGGGRN
ncbi:efflux RND transporter periplasmic adaptor subunit [Paenibacillus antri]|uniref:Efflux RND transporter periplasmic adaptor subunit n=1 Tax=Paenibacillus antri TaxID=2582848 RepID=A0A5R9G3Z8_9BACL|nr:efflux RND transporter periplasmic adaptor subunit [Paenibacillus antri]TLS49036.1 efflux RND transporter periplasmic adaptor subunit [Paenibacillus antri]